MTNERARKDWPDNLRVTLIILVGWLACRIARGFELAPGARRFGATVLYIQAIWTVVSLVAGVGYGAVRRLLSR